MKVPPSKLKDLEDEGHEEREEAMARIFIFGGIIDYSSDFFPSLGGVPPGAGPWGEKEIKREKRREGMGWDGMFSQYFMVQETMTDPRVICVWIPSPPK